MRALSLDLRERILAAAREGASAGELARRFMVGIATVRKYRVQQQRLGHVRPLRRAPTPPILDPYRVAIEAHLRKHPSATLADLIRHVVEIGGPEVASSTMHGACRRFGLALRKSR
jgi:transposase